MKESALNELIESGEGECVEFKTASKGVYDDTFETVCSFCNHLGGDILLGVNDHGKVVGVPRKTIADMINYIQKRCSCLDVFSSVVDVALNVEKLRKRKIIRIHIEPLDKKVAYKGVSYSRCGESDYKMYNPI